MFVIKLCDSELQHTEAMEPKEESRAGTVYPAILCKSPQALDPCPEPQQAGLSQSLSRGAEANALLRSQVDYIYCFHLIYMACHSIIEGN